MFVLREHVEAFLSTLPPADDDGYRVAAPPPGERAAPRANAAWEPEVRYLMCTVCTAPMARQAFARLSGVIVDVCPRHGTWFDHREAEIVAKWVDQLPELRRIEAQHSSRTSVPLSRAELRERLLEALRR